MWRMIITLIRGWQLLTTDHCAKHLIWIKILGLCPRRWILFFLIPFFTDEGKGVVLRSNVKEERWWPNSSDLLHVPRASLRSCSCSGWWFHTQLHHVTSLLQGRSSQMASSQWLVWWVIFPLWTLTIFCFCLYFTFMTPLCIRLLKNTLSYCNKKL